jgi:integrase/recombinase XerD
MIHYRNNGIGLKLIRKKTTKEDSEERRIYWQITYKRRSVLYYTGSSFTEAEWDDILNKNLRKHKLVKEGYQNFFDYTIRPIIDDLAEHNNFSFDEFESKLSGKGSHKISVNEAFQQKLELLEREFRVSSYGVYKATIKALMRFKHFKQLKNRSEKNAFIALCKEKRHITIGKDVLDIEHTIRFEEITPGFLEECEKFWFETEISPATMGIYMRSLRAIINNNRGDKPYIDAEKYPFGVSRGKYAIPEGGRREIALSIEQIWKIEEYQTENGTLATARDIFVFMFYCNGLNFGDLCRLRYENIDVSNNEIVFQRKKTLRKTAKPTFIYVPILPPMIEIINRQGNKDQNGYIFPFLNGIEPTESNERKIINAMRLNLDPINTSLKQIANELGLDPDLSTSYTRNSYITHLTSELLVNPIVVRKMVGHSTKKDVTAGYVKLTAKKRREINMKLLNPEKRYTAINSGRVI